MEARDKAAFRKRLKGSELCGFFQHIRERQPEVGRLLFLCVGTDRSTGDALGPLVGTMLEEAGYPYVIGTLRQPLDSNNLQARLAEIPQGLCVIAIDACLGLRASVGSYQVSNRPIEPGKAVGGGLPHVGDYGIAAIVNNGEGNKYANLQSTSLYRVMEMSKEIVHAIKHVFPLEQLGG
jgi:putative sporulation protein YyaC